MQMSEEQQSSWATNLQLHMIAAHQAEPNDAFKNGSLFDLHRRMFPQCASFQTDYTPREESEQPSVAPVRWIMLHGAQGVGKDAVGKILVEKHGYVRYAFADRLKEVCEVLDPVVGWEVNNDTPHGSPVRLTAVIARYGWDKAKKSYPEVRRIQQCLATEVIQDFVSQTYWADYVVDQARWQGRVVITDLRFQHEYDAVMRATAGEVDTWWVQRPGFEHKPGEHARSESWHPPHFYVVDNNRTLDDLEVTVQFLLDGHAPLVMLDQDPTDMHVAREA